MKPFKLEKLARDRITVFVTNNDYDPYDSRSETCKTIRSCCEQKPFQNSQIIGVESDLELKQILSRINSRYPLPPQACVLLIDKWEAYKYSNFVRNLFFNSRHYRLSSFIPMTHHQLSLIPSPLRGNICYLFVQYDPR